MADDKKSGGDGMSMGALFLGGMALLFIMWIVSGGPSRIENKYNPGLLPPETPFDTFEVYGEGGRIQTKVEDIIQNGIHTGWKIENKKNFAFLTPPGWITSSTGNLSNTEFGEITNGTITLNYQYGREVNTLDFEDNLDYSVAYGTVDGEWARFVKPKNTFAETTGAYIKKSRRKQLTIYTNDPLTPEEQTQVFEIINTVKF